MPKFLSYNGDKCRIQHTVDIDGVLETHIGEIALHDVPYEVIPNKTIPDSMIVECPKPFCNYKKSVNKYKNEYDKEFFRRVELARELHDVVIEPNITKDKEYKFFDTVEYNENDVIGTHKKIDNVTVEHHYVTINIKKLYFEDGLVWLKCPMEKCGQIFVAKENGPRTESTFYQYFKEIIDKQKPKKKENEVKEDVIDKHEDVVLEKKPRKKTIPLGELIASQEEAPSIIEENLNGESN